MSLGERIKSSREKQGLSQERLGELLGVSFQAVSSWERDLTTPDTSRLASLARVLQVNLAYLLEETPATVDWDRSDRLFHEDRMYTFIKAAATTRGLQQTLRALHFAREKHLGQLRKGQAGIPYISHPLTMCCHALAMDLHEDELLAAILLHDVVEDCGVSPEDLPLEENARETVRLLSKDKRHEDDEEGYDKVYFAGIGENSHAMLVKLLDRCHNLSVMSSGFTRERIITYIQHTQIWVMPLIDRLQARAPQYSNACFLLKYQMQSLMFTVMHLRAMP